MAITKNSQISNEIVRFVGENFNNSRVANKTQDC